MESSIKASAAKLITNASNLCIDGGLHRLVRQPNDAGNLQKRMLFWMVYCIDRALTLNFGRAPNIQDYDITADVHDISADVLSWAEEIPNIWGLLVVHWVIGELRERLLWKHR